MAFSNFEDLQVWQRGLSLSAKVYDLFEDKRIYSLRGQMERSALSIPSNIAEGQERDTPKEFRRFLHFAKGSCGEFRTQAYVAKRRNYLPENEVNWMIQESIEISSMLQGLIRSIQAKLDT